MHRRRITRLAALALVVGAVTAPVASAQQDLRNPDNRAVLPQEIRQDFRNPDNRGAVPAHPRQDLRSPDAVDAAAGRGTFNAPEVVVVRQPQSQPVADGIDWGDAAIGVGGAVALSLIGLGGALAIVHRRQAGHALRS